LEAALDELEKIQEKAIDGGLDTAVYISMAFGNPYGDPWSIEEVVERLEFWRPRTFERSHWPTPWAWPRRNKLAIWLAR